MTRPLIIYHANCMDGAGAALAAWLRFGDEAEYRAANYGDPAPTNEEVRARDVYVLDFSYPRADLVRMFDALDDGGVTLDCRGERVGSLIVLDHHKTAQADLVGLPFCTFDITKSGAVLAWHHLIGDEIDENAPPELFRYIQDRDLWRWELPCSREVSAALAALGAAEDFRKLIPIYKEWNVWSRWAADGHLPLPDLRIEGAAILRAQEQQVARAVATAEEVEIRYVVLSGEFIDEQDNEEAAAVGYFPDCEYKTVRALAVSCPLLQSEVGEALALESARRGRDAVGAIYYRDGKSGTWRVSLRSRDVTADDVAEMAGLLVAPDVSAIAKAFNGGGHHRAAGFECAQLPWERR